ncbi:MAG TPA: hypothetical protein VFN71_10410 [Methylomirabilota bacterium]|nr:hypothetical protein [Methylomirabilota bacterium]
MPAIAHLGLSKEQVRRIVLSKLRVVYRDWGLADGPFWSDREVRPGGRRGNERAFETALVAALLGGLSEAVEKNNKALAKALDRPARHLGTAGPKERRRR